MKFTVRVSRNLDLLNLLNILTADPFYTSCHAGIYERFAGELSERSKERISEAIGVNGNAMLGPQLCLIISSVPHFERRALVKMLSEPDLLHDCFSRQPYFDEGSWQRDRDVIGLLKPVIEELEMGSFRDQWRKERLPRIRLMRAKLRLIAERYSLDREIDSMLGKGQAPESITVYLCSFAAPHGIKVCGPRYISDIAFTEEQTIGIAVHEMFHPPYDAKNLKRELRLLGEDPLLERSFATKDARFGYPSMADFIEENVVEAMAITICHRLGLEADPRSYFAAHDGGSHRLSVVLYDSFQKHPKTPDLRFEDYFRNLLSLIPVGSLDRTYEEIMALGEEVS